MVVEVVEEEEGEVEKAMKEKVGTLTTAEASTPCVATAAAVADSNSREGALLPQESSSEGGEGVAGGVSMVGSGRSLKQADS